MNKINSVLMAFFCTICLSACSQTIATQVDMSDSTNTLEDSVQTLEIAYTVWGCACPNWIRVSEVENNDTLRPYISYHFYLEPADSTLEIPETFDAATHHLRVTGQFYTKKDYPKGTYPSEEILPKAKVFRYTKVELLEE